MKKIIVAVCTVALLGLTLVASAAASLKIGVVDIHKILKDSPQVVAINKKLEKQFKPRQEKIVAAEKKLQAEIKKADREHAVLSQEQRDKLVAKVGQDRRNLERNQQDFHDDLSLAQHQELQGLFERIQHKIDQIAKKDHYDLILQKYGTPYASKGIDITTQVEKALQ